MTQPTVVDLAILGGGCAGLSLARELSLRQVRRPIVVIEPRTNYEDDRSWCFWAPQTPASPTSILAFVQHQWPRWLFGQAGATVTARQTPGLSYQYLRSADFYQVCRDSIESSPSVQLRLGQAVQTVLPVAAGWQVITNTETFVARQVVDTRPPDTDRRAQATLQQAFLGLEIELAIPIDLATDSVELMTDMRVVDQAFCFTYVLPYSPTRLLVEVTFFARKPPEMSLLEATLAALLVDRGWQDVRVVRREYAVLPMGLPAVTEQPGQPPRAGMGGGALRASSGYGFLRIQRWAQQCALHYQVSGEVLGHPKPGFGWRWMDQLFLDVIATSPALAPALFEQLLSRTEPSRFVRFMNDEATLKDCLQVIGCLPKRPFLQVLANRLQSWVRLSS